MKNKLEEILRTKKKYLILAGIYLLCLVITVVANPWAYDISDDKTYDEHFDSSFYMFEIRSAQDNFYEELSWELPFERRSDSVMAKMAVRLLSFGADDIYSFHIGFPSYTFRETVRVTFPLMMILKLAVCKRLFKKEKDRVELDKPKFRLLYYRSESMMAEIAADNITFFLIGAATKLMAGATDWLTAVSGGSLRGLLDLLYSLLLVITLPIYRASQFLLDSYRSTYISVTNEWVRFFIIVPLMNLGLIICFELMLRAMMRLYELALQALGRVYRRLTKFINERISEAYR